MKVASGRPIDEADIIRLREHCASDLPPRKPVLPDVSRS